MVLQNTINGFAGLSLLQKDYILLGHMTRLFPDKHIEGSQDRGLFLHLYSSVHVDVSLITVAENSPNLTWNCLQ